MSWVNKDGAHLLIQAFAIIHKRFPDMKLKMIGDTRNTELFNKIMMLSIPCIV